MNLTDAFTDRIKKTADAGLSAETLHRVKRCLIDYLGVTFAGRRYLGAELNELERLGGNGRCSVIASGRRTDMLTAAMLNGIAAHVLEFDDGHRAGAPHLEAVIVSAMIAAAQEERIPFERFVKGIIAGYEATIRLSAAMQPGLKLRGFHATGVCGTIGAACAVGYALGLNDKQFKSAFSAAASASAGILRVLDDDSGLKPFNVANAVQSGITAVYTGKCGIKGPDDVLGGERGYLHAHSDEVDLNRLLGETEKPAIFEIYLKPFASCRHSHPAVECALALRKKYRFDAGEIEDVEIQTYKLGILAHDATDITSVSGAKMSTPYSTAAALVLGSCGMEAFSKEATDDPEIKALTKKIRVVENERMTEACPGKRGASVTIKLSGGRVCIEEVENPLGEPENGLTDRQLEEKYDSLMKYAGVSESERTKIKDLVRNLDGDYGEFIAAV